MICYLYFLSVLGDCNVFCHRDNRGTWKLFTFLKKELHFAFVMSDNCEHWLCVNNKEIRMGKRKELIILMARHRDGAV